MEASADWPSLQKRGFLVVKQFLSADLCAELAERYQTLPAATDSIGFGVRWASKHVAQPYALPSRPSLRSPCNLAPGCSAQQGVSGRSGGGGIVGRANGASFNTIQMGLPPSVMQKIHEALPLVEKHSDIKVDAECCHLMNSMQAAHMCTHMHMHMHMHVHTCATYVQCMCSACAVHVQCMCSACALYVHCGCTVHAPP